MAAAAAAAAARPPADVEVKLVVLGNTFVGKSCLLHRFTDGVFAGPAMMATVGVDWSIRTVELEPPPTVALAGGRAGTGAAAEPAATSLVRALRRLCFAVPAKPTLSLAGSQAMWALHTALEGLGMSTIKTD